jgi:hypothetical protein
MTWVTGMWNSENNFNMKCDTVFTLNSADNAEVVNI